MGPAARRLGRAAQQVMGSSYSHAKREVVLGHVLVNGAVVTDPGALVHEEDTVTHDPNRPRLARAHRAAPIVFLHLDAEVVVVDKPAGVLVHPADESDRDTVLSRTAAELERRTGRHRRVLVVHRLDRDTSGVLVLGLSPQAVQRLQTQFRAHTIERRYLALVRGDLTGEVIVARGIGRPRPGARRAALAPGTGGRSAHTVVRPLERLPGATLVEAELGTGRTHQVRVHLSYLGHPVIGDAVYGDPATDPLTTGRMALHAALLAFVHPATGQRMTFTSEPPRDFAHALESLRRRRHVRGRPAEAAGARPARRGGATATPPPRPRTPRRHGAGAGPRPPGTKGRPRPARSGRRG
jgi:23S rRNA pseudouridine1911/1915/1917 synthase